MIIVNITLVTERDKTERLAAWLRDEKVIPMAEAGLSPRACHVLNPDPEAAASIALQVEFPDMQAAEKWMATDLLDLMREYEAKFGPQALSFQTLLETI